MLAGMMAKAGSRCNSILPIVPITDLTIKNNNLIVATQGRSLWLLDDLTVLHQLAEMDKTKPFLFAPMPSYSIKGQAGKPSLLAGQNHPGEVNVYLYLPEEPDSAKELAIVFTEKDDWGIRRFSTQSKEKKDQLKDLKAGLNHIRWDMRYAPAEKVDGMILWWAQLDGPRALPGDYKVMLEYGDVEQTQPFSIIKDPRSSSTEADLKAQFDFLIKNRDKLTDMHEAIIAMRKLRGQLADWKARADKDSAFANISEKAQSLIDASKPDGGNAVSNQEPFAPGPAQLSYSPEQQAGPPWLACRHG